MAETGGVCVRSTVLSEIRHSFNKACVEVGYTQRYMYTRTRTHRELDKNALASVFSLVVGSASDERCAEKAAREGGREMRDELMSGEVR